MPTKATEQQLLSLAVTAQSNDYSKESADVVIDNSHDAKSAADWVLSFSPSNHCFFISLNGRTRLRTASPQIACSYYSTRPAR